MYMNKTVTILANWGEWTVFWYYSFYTGAIFRSHSLYCGSFQVLQFILRQFSSLTVYTAADCRSYSLYCGSFQVLQLILWQFSGLTAYTAAVFRSYSLYCGSFQVLQFICWQFPNLIVFILVQFAGLIVSNTLKRFNKKFSKFYILLLRSYRLKLNWLWKIEILV